MPKSCMPMTAKIKMIIPKTKVKFPRSPTVLPMIEINKLSVGHDLANLKTRSFKESNCLVFESFKLYKKINYQTKRAQHRKTGNRSETKLKKGKQHNDKIKNIPALTKIKLGTKSNQLEQGFDCKSSGEKLLINM